MEGIIFDIKHFAVHDGPGIRSTVFFKGCPLSCGWCHNPESISPEIIYVEKEVQLDGQKFKKRECIGEQKTVRFLLNELKDYQLFYHESGGGVTFSGGEPMMQIDFLEELLIHSKLNGWHTAVDTSGQSVWQNFKRVLPLTDLFLFDLKHLQSDLHEKGTGVSNKIILENLKKLCSEGATLIIRIPVVPGFNFSKEVMHEIGAYLKKLGGHILQIDLLPFHAIGRHKYIQSGIKNRFGDVHSLHQKDLMELKKILAAYDFTVTIGA